MASSNNSLTINPPPGGRAPRRLYVRVDPETWIRDHTVQIPSAGELIMLRLPFDMPGPVSEVTSTAVTGATRTNWHPCLVVRSADLSSDKIWKVTIFVCRSFKYLDPVHSIAFVASLPESDRELLVPLRPTLPGLPLAPYPRAFFGPPLEFASEFHLLRPTWAIARPIELTISPGVPYKPFPPAACLPGHDIQRLLEYATRAAASPSELIFPTNPDDHPNPFARSGGAGPTYGPSSSDHPTGYDETGPDGNMGDGSQGQSDANYRSRAADHDATSIKWTFFKSDYQYPSRPAIVSGIVLDDCESDDEDAISEDGDFTMSDFWHFLAPYDPVSAALAHRYDVQRQKEVRSAVISWQRSL